MISIKTVSIRRFMILINSDTIIVKKCGIIWENVLNQNTSFSFGNFLVGDLGW